jgi:hypothetical protein
MCIICTMSDYTTLINLKTLNCSDCPLLTSIPNTLVNLTRLGCVNCPLLTSIPDTLINLKIVDFISCPLLTSIPDTLVNLKIISCFNCPLLTSIPDTLVNLKIISCFNCPLLYLPAKYEKLTYIKNSSSNMLRINIWQRKIRKRCYHKFIYESELHPISSVILKYM